MEIQLPLLQRSVRVAHSVHPAFVLARIFALQASFIQRYKNLNLSPIRMHRRLGHTSSSRSLRLSCSLSPTLYCLESVADNAVASFCIEKSAVRFQNAVTRTHFVSAQLTWRASNASRVARHSVSRVMISRCCCGTIIRLKTSHKTNELWTIALQQDFT